MRTAAFVSWLFVLVAAPFSAATNFAAFDRAEQVATSDAIVCGRVGRVESFWEGSSIVTEAVVEVEEAWKGNPQAEIRVRTLGGTVGDVMLRVDGAASFTEGERVVLFLERTPEGYAPRGMAFGKYSIGGPPGEEFALGSLPPAVPGAQRYPELSVSLAELREEVRSLVAREASR